MALESGWSDADLARFWSKVHRSGGCWIWRGARSAKGYGVLGIGPRHVHRQVRAHRMAWEIANGRAIPEGLVVRHTCDVPACVRPDHLLLGTIADNNRDIHARGRGAIGDRNGSRKHPERLARGVRNPRALLTDDVVRYARRRYRSGGVTYRELAEDAGVDLTTMRLAVTGKTWAHVLDDQDEVA